MPRDGLMDPQQSDVAKPKRKRPRKLRGRADPPIDLIAYKTGAEKRVKARPTHPMIMLEPTGFDREAMVPLFNDERLHDLMLADAFGTRSYAVMSTFLQQLETLCCERWWDEEAQQWRLNEPTFNTILALVGSIKPKNEMEAAFAAQMAAVHMLSMKVSARAIRYEYDTKTVHAAGKLARTFVMQMQELRAMRGKTKSTRQNIKVSRETHHHQHIHVHREAGENDGQSHAPSEPVCRNPAAITIDDRDALPGADEGGRVVPLPSRARPRAVPDARRN